MTDTMHNLVILAVLLVVVALLGVAYMTMREYDFVTLLQVVSTLAQSSLIITYAYQGWKRAEEKEKQEKKEEDEP